MPVSARTVDERSVGPAFPGLVHPEWADCWPWLAQGTTWRGEDGSFDPGLAGTNPVGPTLQRWRELGAALGFRAIVAARQVHGARVLEHVRYSDGLLLAGLADGHATGQPGLLLAVSIADCVPVFVLAPAVRAIALLHAGWRGTAAGILEAGVATLTDSFDCTPADLRIHLGPAICGRCYEAGPEVHAALGLVRPGTPEPVDLRQHLALKAISAGVAPDGITSSSACTRCEPDRFFSHRAGARGRQLAWLGIRQN